MSGRKNIITDNIPCFFKFVKPGFTTDKLGIPRVFENHIRPVNSGLVTVTDASGGTWRVRLQEDENSALVLLDGWTDFVRDHSLQDNQILLFGYYGNMSFHVQIFDQDGMEIVISPDSPSFEQQLVQWNIGVPFQLYVPYAFAVEHLPSEKSNITLRNSKGESWQMTHSVNGKTHRLFGRGWRKFVDDNKLKVGDLCKFKPAGDKEMMVQIVRSRPAR